MAETSTSLDLAEQFKAATVLFSNVFTPSPLLKAQTDLLTGFEPALSGWLHRRHDAATDAQQLIARLTTISNPFEALRMQQEWISRAFLRLAADTAACQSATQQLVERARTWLPRGAESDDLASKGGDAVQGADRTEKTTPESAEAAAARAARPAMRIAEKAG